MPRRELFSLSLVAALCVSAHATTSGHAQQLRVRVDTVLVARDFDGDGNTDYIIRESKASRGGPRPQRLAIYLGVAPASARAAWATEWDAEFGADVEVSEVLPLGTSSTLVAVSLPEADYVGTRVVLIRARRAKTIVSHGIDYGEGYFQLRLEGGRAIVDATQEHLVLGGKAVDGALACPDAQLPALRLIFDPRSERFVPENPRCVKLPSQTQSPRTRVDTVLLARDLDGDGKVDYVVRESSDTTPDSQRPARLAIYVGAKPGTQPAAWASPWDEEYGSDVKLADSIRVDAKGTLLEVDRPADDVLFISVLLVDRSTIRELVSHAVGMDEGAFRLSHAGDRITIDATPRTLLIEGKEVDVSLECNKGRRAELRLRFDRPTRSFVAMAPRCVRPKP